MKQIDVVLLGRALREHGVAVTPAEVITAVTAFQFIDHSDREEVFLSLRAVFTSRVDDFEIFKELFDKYWQGTFESEGLSKTTLRARPGSPTYGGLAYFLENWSTSFSDDSEPI